MYLRNYKITSSWDTVHQPLSDKSESNLAKNISSVLSSCLILASEDLIPSFRD
jgi:hypothetical protein